VVVEVSLLSNNVVDVDVDVDVNVDNSRGGTDFNNIEAVAEYEEHVAVVVVVVDDRALVIVLCVGKTNAEVTVTASNTKQKNNK